MTASRRACTPLFLKEAPHSTGNRVMAMVPLRTAARSSSLLMGSPPTYFSMRWSSTSASPSIIFSRYSRTRSTMSAGTGAFLNSLPRVSSLSSHTRATSSTRSTSPW